MGGTITGPDLLDKAVPSALSDLDASLSTSYDGSSQNWVDALGNGGDMYLGIDGTVSSDDPSWADGEFSHDGGDFFHIQSQPNFWRDLHKNGAGKTFFLAIAFKTPSSLTTIYQLDTAVANNNNHGITLRTLSNGRIDFFQFDGSGSELSLTPTGVVQANSDTLIIVTYSEDDTTLNVYHNGTKYTNSSFVFDVDTTDATQGVRCMNNGASFSAPNGTITRAVGWGTGFISDAEAAAIKDLYESRHGVTYS